MIFALALALQQPPQIPLPPQVEPAVQSYVRCLSIETERHRPTLMEKPDKGAEIFDLARRTCAEARAQSIASSEAALSALPAYADAVRRRAFVAERFDGLDQIMRETFSGGMDPDKWEK